MKYSSSVNNYRETPYIISDTFANQVNYSAAIKGAIYICRDGASLSEPSIYQANGTIWVAIGAYGIGTDATLQDVTTNGNTTDKGITITALGLSTNTLTVTSLTPKSIPFVGTADLLTEDNTNLVWDNVNKWLGIQTSTPTSELDIHSTTAAPMIALNNTAGSPSNILFQNTNVSKWRIGNAASNKFAIFNNNLSTTALGIDTTNNSVGINTLSPVANLNLVSTSSIVTFQLHNSVTGSLASDGAKIAVSNNEMQIVNREAADIIFYTSDAERLRLLSTGALSSNGFGFIANMGTTNTSGYILNRTSDLYNALIELQNNNTSTWKIGLLPTSNNLSFYSSSLVNTALTITNITGNLLVGSEIDDTLNKLQITGNGTVTGNFGIGNSSPVSKLSVKGVGDATGVTLTLENGGSISLLNDPLGIINFYSNDPSAGCSGIYGTISVNNAFNGAWNGTLTRNSTYIAFSTSNANTLSEKARITNEGNLLVGTTTDNSSRLQVAGNISLTTAGNKLLIATGTNASAGTTAALTAGTITVNTTAALTGSTILLTAQTTGGTAGALRVSSRVNATSFTITSTSATDTSTVGYLIIN
jgi:hypothetical protein